MRGAQLTAGPFHVLALTPPITQSKGSIHYVGFSRMKDFWGRLEVGRKKKANFLNHSLSFLPYRAITVS